MKLIFLILMSTFVLSCNLVSKPNTELDKKILSEKPKAMTIKISVNSITDYKSIAISDRCEGYDGPRSYKTKINIENKDVIEYDVWSDRSKSLLERSVILHNKKPTLFTYVQSGCAHHGFTYTFKVNEHLSVHKPRDTVEYAFGLFKKWQAQSLFKEERIIKLAEGQFLGNKTSQDCEVSKNQILCSYHKDPENLGLMIKEIDEYSTEISMNYWFVL